MSWIDILLLLPLPIGFAIGIRRGLILELTAIISIIIGCFCTHFMSAPLAVWLTIQFAWSEILCSVLAYSIIFLIVTIIINLIGRLLTKLTKVVYLGWLNKTLGAVFGLIKYAVIVIFILICVHRLDKQYFFVSSDFKNKSAIYTGITPLSEAIWITYEEQTNDLTQQTTDNTTKKNEQ